MSESLGTCMLTSMTLLAWLLVSALGQLTSLKLSPSNLHCWGPLTLPNLAWGECTSTPLQPHMSGGSPFLLVSRMTLSPLTISGALSPTATLSKLDSLLRLTLCVAPMTLAMPLCPMCLTTLLPSLGSKRVLSHLTPLQLTYVILPANTNGCGATVTKLASSQGL